MSTGTTHPDADGLRTMPVAQIVTFWRPGSHDWSWADEYADVMAHAQTPAIRERVRAEGFGFADTFGPVLLGSDGRVWDGHHRICLAIEAGHPSLRVDVATPRAAGGDDA